MNLGLRCRSELRSPCLLPSGLRLLTLLLIVFALATFSIAQAGERRVALLIGNANYQHEKKLSNPINDAELLGSVLKDTLKFDDVRIERNLNVNAMDKVVEDFAKAAKGADSVVFYYSGHGIKSPDRRSFLLPIDARTGTGDAPALDRQAVAAEAIRDKLKAAGARVTLLILDACRDGPGGGKSGSKGLARLGGNSNGLLIAYATEEDQIAQDGKGRNSPYAEALAQALKRTDLPILEQLDWVADEVHRKEPSQMPTRDGNLRAKAYLVGPQGGSAKPAQNTDHNNPRTTDFSFGPVQLYSDGTFHAYMDVVTTKVMLRTCLEGLQYVNKKCVGVPTVFSLDEARSAVESANREAFAGYTNWRIPKLSEMQAYLAMSQEFKTAATESKEKRALSANMFHAGEASFQTWMLPGEEGRINGMFEAGAGFQIRKDGRYSLRLVRTLE